MEVSGDRFSTASARAGVTIQHTTQVNERDLTFKVKPYIARQWEIEDAGNTTSFVGAGSATTVNGRDLTVVETGLGAEAKYDLSDSTSLKFGADLSKDRYEQRYVSFVGVGVKF
jgi:outer membrane autotransporter protein